MNWCVPCWFLRARAGQRPEATFTRYVNQHMYKRCILNNTTGAALRDPSACLRVGACRLAGLRTPTTQTEGPSSNDGAAPSLRAVPPGEHDEALTLWCELNFFSASFHRGARAASLSDHGAAPTWGSSGSRARRRSGSGNSSNSSRSANGGSGSTNGSGASGSDAASRAAAIAVDAPEVARACRVGSASNSAGVACGAGTAGGGGGRPGRRL